LRATDYVEQQQIAKLSAACRARAGAAAKRIANTVEARRVLQSDFEAQQVY
jgi:hypothetical protein